MYLSPQELTLSWRCLFIRGLDSLLEVFLEVLIPLKTPPTSEVSSPPRDTFPLEILFSSSRCPSHWGRNSSSRQMLAQLTLFSPSKVPLCLTSNLRSLAGCKSPSPSRVWFIIRGLLGCSWNSGLMCSNDEHVSSVGAIHASPKVEKKFFSANWFRIPRYWSLELVGGSNLLKQKSTHTPPSRPPMTPRASYGSSGNQVIDPPGWIWTTHAPRSSQNL